MLNTFKEWLLSLRGRWLWARGRCPLCNRNLYARFAYYMANYPNCPVCTDETETDLRLWHNYRTSGAAQGPAVVAVKE